MEAVGYAQTGGVTDAAVHHVTASSHHETHPRGPFQYLGRGLDEILRSFLEGDPAEEGHNLVADSPLNLKVLATAEIHRIVDGHYLVRGYSVFVYDYVPCQVADSHNLIGRLHSTFLYVEDPGINHVLSTAVERGGVDMDHKRLAGQLLGGNSSQIGQPVVGMDDIELIFMLHGDRTTYHSIACHLLKEV